MTKNAIQPTPIDLATARRIAVDAALLGAPELPPTEESVVTVSRHFGGIQIDPTRTVERTQHLVLWSRLRDYDRTLLDAVLRNRQAFEYAAFIVTPDRLPELMYYAQRWPGTGGTWRARATRFLAENAAFRKSILDQLRAEGPLQLRQIDVSKVKVGWESTGWTQGKNASQMLEFMGVKLEVAVAGRVGQERLWDLPERVIPTTAPRDELTEDEYQERRVMRAMARFGLGAFKEIRDRAYGLSIPAAKALFARLVEEGRIVPVDVPFPGKQTPTYALPEVLDAADKKREPRTTLVSPFDPVVYDRARTERLFGFKYALEMYKPKDQREFGHFVLPILHDNQLIGRLDSERDRKANELVIRKVHWEGAQAPDRATQRGVDQAIADLKDFVRAG